MLIFKMVTRVIVPLFDINSHGSICRSDVTHSAAGKNFTLHEVFRSWFRNTIFYSFTFTEW